MRWGKAPISRSGFDLSQALVWQAPRLSIPGRHNNNAAQRITSARIDNQNGFDDPMPRTNIDRLPPDEDIHMPDEASRSDANDNDLVHTSPKSSDDFYRLKANSEGLLEFTRV